MTARNKIFWGVAILLCCSLIVTSAPAHADSCHDLRREERRARKYGDWAIVGASIAAVCTALLATPAAHHAYTSATYSLNALGWGIVFGCPGMMVTLGILAYQYKALARRREDTRKRQACGPDPGDGAGGAGGDGGTGVQCTEDQIKYKATLEAIVKESELKTKVICKNEEGQEICDCELENPLGNGNTPNIPDNAKGQLTPEQLTAINKAWEKAGKGDPTYEDDLKGVYGDFATTDMGSTDFSNMSPALGSALGQLQQAVIENESEPESDTKDVKKKFSFEAPPIGSPSQGTAITAKSKPGDEEARRSWKKAAEDKKSGIIDNDLRGIFAAISGRYEAVQQREIKDHVSVQKGLYHTVK